MAYRAHQPFVFRNAPQGALHEAVGDALALALTNPTQLTALGLLDARKLDNTGVLRPSSIVSPSHAGRELDPVVATQLGTLSYSIGTPHSIISYASR